MTRILILVIILLTACNTFETTSTSLQLPASTTSIDITDLSIPIAGAKYVSLHADRSLRVNISCTQIMRLNLVQKKNYQDTIIELKNRAVLMGGNSVSLIGWREAGPKTILLGNIYMCRNKTYHVHPHPET